MRTKRLLWTCSVLAVIAVAVPVYAAPLLERIVTGWGWSGPRKIDCTLGGCGTSCYPSNPSPGDECRTGPIHECGDFLIDPSPGGPGPQPWNWRPDHPCYGFFHCPCADGRRYIQQTNTYPDASVDGTVGCTWGDDGWCVSAATLTISGSEPIPGESIERIEGDRDGAPFSYGGASAAISEIGDTPATTFTYRAHSTYGDYSAYESSAIRVDTLPPFSAMSNPSDGRWVSGTVSVTGTAGDTTSGVGLVDYSTSGASSWQPAMGTDDWSAAWDTVGGADGDYRVCSRARDAAGNVEGSPGCLTVHVDNSAPVTARAVTGTVGNGNWWLSPVTVTLSASDGAGIGVAGTEYRVVGGGWQPYTAPVVLSDGTPTLEYRSADGLGNRETAQSLQLWIDTVPPATTADVIGPRGLNGWYTATVTVSLSAGDATSGVDATFLGGDAFTGPLTYTADASYRLPYYSTDVAGNRESAHTLAFGLDTAPPSASVTGGTFCPACGQALTLRPTGSDATSGVAAWRLEVAGGEGVLRRWSGTSTPAPVSWNGRLDDGRYRSTGTYELRLWVQDAAGWTATAVGTVKMKSAPLPAPTPTATPTPTPTSTPLPPKPRPEETPLPTTPPTLLPPAPTPKATSTPAPVALAEPEPAPKPVALRAATFQDDDGDGRKGPGEPGLADLEVRVQGGGWSEVFVTDATGLVVIALPGPGIYTIRLTDRPGAAWRATTRTELDVRVGDDGSVVILSGGREVLPVGVAEGVTFAFGLLLSTSPVVLWPFLPLLGTALIWLARSTGRARIAAAIRERVEIERRLFEANQTITSTGGRIEDD